MPLVLPPYCHFLPSTLRNVPARRSSGPQQSRAYSLQFAIPETNFFHGATITFTNNVTAIGNQGCTPGYWKQKQHFDSWKVYSRNADFDATFGVNFFNPNITLLEALQLDGGGVDALARHGVAGLLDAAAGSGVNYQYTTAQVIAIVQGSGAYSGLSYEDRKNLLAAANEAVGGCPLN